MHRKPAIATALLSGCLALWSCLAATPLLTLHTTTELRAPKPWVMDVMRGESLRLATTLHHGGQPAPLPPDATATFYWQAESGMELYWHTPATIATNGLVYADWLPTMDSGHQNYHFFFGLSHASNLLYRIYGTLRLKPSPGALPNALPLPTPTLDFAQIALTNAPWLTTEHDPVWQAAANRVLYRDKVNSVEYENFGLLAFDMDHWLIRSMFLQPDKLTYSSGGEWSDSYGTELSPSGLNASFSFGDSSIAAQFRARGLEVGNGELHLLYPWPGLDPANPQSLATLESVASHNTAPDSHQDIRQMIADLPRPPTNAAAGWYVWDSGSNCYWRVVSTNLQFYVYPD